VALLLVLLVAPARAATKIAITPLRDAPDVAQLEKALIDAVRDMPSLQLVNAAGGRLQGAKNGQAEARSEAHATARAQALGRETGAQRVLAIEAARIGEGRVLYLQAVDTASGRPVGSTTAPLSGESGEVAAADRWHLRAALVRVLDPGRYVGRLNLKVDVPNAEAEIDGQKPSSVKQAIELPVGTHAVRIHHPAYRDFLRFVDLEFDKTVTLDVALSAYPLAEGEMTEELRRQAEVTKQKKMAWYRSWWALSVAAAALAGGAAAVVYILRPGVPFDRSVDYKFMPVP
jgi:hypothetical protein